MPIAIIVEGDLSLYYVAILETLEAQSVFLQKLSSFIKISWNNTLPGWKATYQEKAEPIGISETLTNQ